MGDTAAPESQGQLIVALAIVAAVTVLGLALIVASVLAQDKDYAVAGVGTIIGGLLSALNAPTGIAKVLQAAKGQPVAQPNQPPRPPPGPQS